MALITNRSVVPNAEGGKVFGFNNNVNRQRATLKDIGNKGTTEIQNFPAKNLIKKSDILKPLKPSNFLIHKEEPVAKPAVAKPQVDAVKNVVKKEKDQVESLVSAFSEKLLPIHNIDKDEKNPQLVSEYANDIYDYLRLLERRFPIKCKFLDGKEIDGRMRSILVDWLVQVHLRFNLLPETLYLTIAIIDRFLQEVEIKKDKLQLVGVAAMFIASKYEEMYAPEIGDFVYITDNTYMKAEIRRMEIYILKQLDYSLGRPLPIHFLRRYTKAAEGDAQLHTLAKYIMELALVEYDYAHYDPSHIAAAAFCISQKILGASTWNDTLVEHSKYKEMELRQLMNKFALMLTKSETKKQKAVRIKYASSKFMKISLLPELKCNLLMTMAAAAI